MHIIGDHCKRSESNDVTTREKLHARLYSIIKRGREGLLKMDDKGGPMQFCRVSLAVERIWAAAKDSAAMDSDGFISVPHRGGKPKMPQDGGGPSSAAETVGHLDLTADERAWLLREELPADAEGFRGCDENESALPPAVHGTAEASSEPRFAPSAPGGGARDQMKADPERGPCQLTMEGVKAESALSTEGDGFPAYLATQQQLLVLQRRLTKALQQVNSLDPDRPALPRIVRILVSGSLAALLIRLTFFRRSGLSGWARPRAASGRSLAASPPAAAALPGSSSATTWLAAPWGRA